jgi:Glu-tRNA(Gln) amidotransferase subunit E-like FAD-binding protein
LFRVDVKCLKFHPLEEIFFEDHNSLILRAKLNKIHFFRVDGLEGAFVKEGENTRRFGRKICDLVKEKFSCMGFFTSDELPRYGISRKQKKAMFEIINKKEGQLIIFLAYDRDKADIIRKYLIEVCSDENIFKDYGLI